jgi:succinyl-diaminopimelate desuccinylase
LESKIRELCPPGINYELTNFHSADAVSVPLESPFIKAAADAVARGFGTQPVFIRTGGSIPIVLEFAERLGADSILLGWGLDDDNPHSPNEKFCVADFHRGIRTSCHLWEAMAQVRPATTQRRRAAEHATKVTS